MTIVAGELASQDRKYVLIDGLQHPSQPRTSRLHGEIAKARNLVNSLASNDSRLDAIFCIAPAPFPPAELYASGSNELWEHSLLLENDPRSLKRVKPKSNDTPEVKYEFIQSKHKLLSFIPRVDLNDQQQAQQLSEELHSTVRTPAVMEALRLLVLGASEFYKRIEMFVYGSHSSRSKLVAFDEKQ